MIMDLIDILSDFDKAHYILYKEQTGGFRDMSDVYEMVFYMVFKVDNPYVMIILNQITMAYPTEFNETANIMNGVFELESMKEVPTIWKLSKQKNKNYRSLNNENNPYVKLLYGETVDLVEEDRDPSFNSGPMNLEPNVVDAETEQLTKELMFEDQEQMFMNSDNGMMKVVIEDGPEENKDSNIKKKNGPQTTCVDEMAVEKIRQLSKQPLEEI
jgi:hypothetical protein